MRSPRKTLLGLGDSPDEKELKSIMEKQNPESTKGSVDTIKYLSDPALLTEEIGGKVGKASRLAVTPGTVNPEERKFFLNSIEAGSSKRIIDIKDRPLLIGVFSNSDFKAPSDDKRMMMGLPRVTFKDNHLRITALEVNSPSGLNRDKLKDLIIGRAKAKLSGETAHEINLKPGMLDELRFDLDTATNRLNTLTSGNGQRCFMLRSEMISGLDGKPKMKDTIVDASQVENLKLEKGDVILVASKKILDALMMNTTNSIDVSSDYYESALANQILGLLKSNKRKKGQVDVTEVFREIERIYRLEMTVKPKDGLLASSFVVYQV